MQAEKDLAKAKMQIAHEVRLAREAEAAMDLHVAKADELAKREMAKHCPDQDREIADERNEHQPPQLS